MFHPAKLSKKSKIQTRKAEAKTFDKLIEGLLQQEGEPDLTSWLKIGESFLNNFNIFTPEFTKNIMNYTAGLKEQMREAFKIQEAVLCEQSFTDPISSAIHCKVLCVTLYSHQLGLIQMELNLLPTLQAQTSSFLSKQKNLLSMDLTKHPIYNAITSLMSYIPLENQIALIFFDELEQHSIKFKDNPVTMQQVRKIIPHAEPQEIKQLYALIQQARECTIAYSESYFKHHKQLLKLCGQKKISKADLMQRQKQLLSEMIGTIESHPSVINAPKDLYFMIMTRLLSIKKFTEQYSVKGKIDITIESLFESFAQVNMSELMSLGTSLNLSRVPSKLEYKSSPMTHDEAWDIRRFRQAYAKGTSISDDKTLVNLCKACQADSRAEVTSFLLNKCNADKLVNQKYKELTPLEHAAKSGSLKNVKLLLKYPIQDLQKAAAFTSNQLIKELIQNKIDQTKTPSAAVTKPQDTVVKTEPTINYEHYLKEYEDQCNLLSTHLSYLQSLLQQRQETLSETEYFDKFSKNLEQLNESYQQFKQQNWKEQFEKCDQTQELQQLIAEVTQQLLAIKQCIKKAEKLPVEIQRAMKEMERYQAPKPIIKALPVKKESKVRVLPSTEEYSPVSIVTMPIRPKLHFSENMLFWQHEKVLQSNKLRAFCEFTIIDNSNAILLRRIQLYAIVFKLMRYMEIQKNPEYLPKDRCDEISRQLGSYTVAMMRNILVRCFQFIGNSDEDIAAELEHFKKFGIVLAKAMLTHQFQPLKDTRLFKNLHQWGKREDSKQGTGAKMAELNVQINYLFTLNGYQLIISSYDETLNQKLIPGMRLAAIEMLRIQVAKYCADINRYSNERHQALATTHITPLDPELNLDNLEITRYVEERLRNDWSERAMSLS